MATVTVDSLPTDQEVAARTPYGVEVHFRTQANEYAVQFYLFSTAYSATTFRTVVQGRSWTLDTRQHYFNEKVGEWEKGKWF